MKDKQTAQKLTPWFCSWCKRPTFNGTYLQAFNEGHVHLVDTDGKGIQKVTPTGIVANGQGYPIDIMVLGTGYRSPFTGGDLGTSVGTEIIGRDGRKMADKWEQQGVSTLPASTPAAFRTSFFRSIFKPVGRPIMRISSTSSPITLVVSSARRSSTCRISRVAWLSSQRPQRKMLG
jgi:cation diffusion facilitator CzcD-associated flavoprotein CzcO